jgi:hypothetical protein
MAVKAQEAPVLGAGIQANAPSKGSFALNMLYSNNCWQVREGFGQVTQFDTEMGAAYGTGASAEAISDWGLLKHLGSRLIKTNFGNLQMLSVFLSEVVTSEGGGPDLAFTYSPLLPVYVVSIYDLTTNERFEVPLYPHTSQVAVGGSFNDGVPDTLGGRDFTNVATAGVEGAVPQYYNAKTALWLKAKDEFFFFEEFNDILYFGNTTAGCWAYLPASFNGTRPTALDVFSDNEYAQSYGESSMITPVVLSPGLAPEAFEYLRTADMPNPVDVAVVQNRLVYASGNTLYWSEPGYPANITGNNWFAVPSEEEITAIAERNSNLMIFTQNETWLYQPSVGAVVSGGRLTRVSDTVGCIGANALCRSGGALIWVDTSGVYQTTSGLSITPLSDDILPFFEREGMTNPLTSYFVKYGQTGMTTEQPTTTLRLKPTGVHCAAVASMGMVVISLPEMSAALVFSGGQWSWWTFESMVNGTLVSAVQNMPSPWVLAYQDDIFAVAGPDIQSLTDDAETAAEADIDFDVKSRSFMILEYGRGGAIDRSISYEDDRKITGYGALVAPVGTVETPQGGIYFGEPIRVPKGYVFPSGVETALTDDYILVPVSVIPQKYNEGPGGSTVTYPNGIDTIVVRVSFDASRWQPVFNHVSNSTVEQLLPTERVSSGTGSEWDLLTYSDHTFGSLSRSGGYLYMRWRGAGGSFYHAPYMNLNYDRQNRLIYLPFKRIPGNADENTSSMGWEVILNSGDTDVTLEDSAGGNPAVHVPVNFFNRWSLGTDSVRKEDSVAQPVDWAYKSTNVGLEDGNELKMRGIWANLLSHGTGAEKLDSAWPYGLFNTLVGSDRKEWMAQIVDMAPAQAAVEQQDESAPFTSTSTLRTRVQKSDGSLVNKVFVEGGTDVLWGNTGAAATEGSDGTVLIGDEDTSDISVSMSVKGQSFSVMNFGFIMNRAEKLMLEGIKAVFRVVGGRRRRGR